MSRNQPNRDSIPILKEMLQEVSTDRTRMWWEKYLRGVIPFRGVGIPKIREVLSTWRNSCGISSLCETKQFDVALELFESQFAEDKIAGILYLQNYCMTCVPWKTRLMRFVTLYDRDLIHDWNTCEWFCVRVLGPTLQSEGKPMAKVLCDWSKSGNLWQARSSAVPFIRVADEPHFYLEINCICTRLIARDERFAKTAVGWLLREVSKHNEDFVISFLNDHIEDFSTEAIKNAAKYFKKHHRAAYLSRVRAASSERSTPRKHVH